MLRRTVLEALHFVKWHWPHFVLVIPGALAVTWIHEAAHAAAVLIQGGRVTEFVWLPSAGYWGRIYYVFPPDASYSGRLISLAPYAVWLACCCTAWVLSWRRRAYEPWFASTIFFWMFLVPLADVANTGFGYLAGAANDFHDAFGDATLLAWLVMIVAGSAAAAAGYDLQRRLYRDRSIGFPAYGLLGVAAGLMVFGLAKVGLLSWIDRVVAFS